MRVSSAMTGLYSTLAETNFVLSSRFDYTHRIGFVRFVGTHAEYDIVDVSNV